MTGKIVASIVALFAAGMIIMGMNQDPQTPTQTQASTTTTEGIAGPTPGSPRRPDKLVLTDAQWKQRLTPDQYRILRNKGTEPAFCGLLNDNHEAGTYYCSGCGNPLFTSDAKFTSGTGWPSFFQPVTKDAIWSHVDRSYGMVRDEVLCARCDGHLGHVFNDGPPPTGLRFCMNSESLVFVAKGKPAPELVTADGK
jgi:methionine-R-sulfoxide reductase